MSVKVTKGGASAADIWAYATRTLTGFTGTPRSNLVGADESIYTRLDVAVSSRAAAADYTAARAAKLDNLDALISSRATAADVWTYATRELTQTKFPFWSSIITQVQGSVSVPAASNTYVNIQPPSGETWWANISSFTDNIISNQLKSAGYADYDGTTIRFHTKSGEGYDYGIYAHLPNVSKILTNTLYASLYFYSASACTGYYGYSGFKLSQPLWSPKRVVNAKPLPWKRPKTKHLPTGLEALDKYAFDIYDINPDKPNQYDLGIILEEDTPLAFDPATNFPVERLTAVVQDDVLADFIAKFKAGAADPVATGYRKYLDRWKKEGIDFGV
jgi:hypothetical protein